MPPDWPQACAEKRKGGVDKGIWRHGEAQGEEEEQEG